MIIRYLDPWGFFQADVGCQPSGLGAHCAIGDVAGGLRCVGV